MTQKIIETLQTLEDAYLKIISTPMVDVSPEGLLKRKETLHDLSLKIMNMETADLHELNKAFSIDKPEMKQALETLKEAILTNTDYLTMLHNIDYGLHILSNFFPLLK